MQITTKELFDRVVTGAQRVKILDARNEDEFRAWRIEGRASPEFLNVPYYEFIDTPEEAIAKVKPHGADWIAVCAKGDSSAFVADVLRESGIATLNLAGGMLAWGEMHVPLLVERGPRFELWQVSRWGKGCLSYVAIAGNEAVVVDPSRKLDVYEDLARSRGASIVEVLDTHVHADHLSGGPELSRRTGAPWFVAKETAIPRTARIGGPDGPTLQARVLPTPGHTPGSTSYLLDGRFLLSGDTLFVSGVGRPDLGGEAEAWGRMLYRTLHGPIESLPRETVVLPAHFSAANEADGSGVVSTTLGAALARSPEVAIETEDAFVDAMRTASRPAPASYQKIIAANLEGRTVDEEIASEWELGKNECAASRNA